MENKSTKIGLAILSAILLVAAVYMVYTTYFQKEKLPIIQAAPEFSMKNTNGETVAFDKVEKVKLVYFFYASCTDVCPISNQILNKVQEELKEEKVFGKDVELFSVTVDPVRDSAEVLKEYANQFGADASGWSFLRSETPAEVREVAEGFGSSVLNEGGEMMHADLIFLVDENNQVRQYYASDKTIDTIVSDVLSLI